MSWLRSRFTTSLMGLLGDSANDDTRQKLHEIRQAMLSCLGALGDSPTVVRLTAKVLYSTDAESLWYLRSDLMQVLAETRGEALARQRVDAISNMFRGLLPAAQQSRPSRLA